MGARSIDDALAPFVAAARAAWPGVNLEPGVFARHIAQLGAGPQRDTLAGLHLTDLWLACACIHGDRRAIAIFDEQFVGQVAAYISRIDSSPAVADEVRQRLRVRLLVGSGRRPPALAGYSGRGALGGWLRMAAVRTLRDLIRASKPHLALDEDDGVRVLAAEGDPELSYLKRRYAHELREVIAAALAALPAKERNLLRLHFVDGLATDAIGPLYRVDGSTVRRWITALRRQLLDDVRARLAENLGLPRDELDSVMALVRSRLDLSLSRHLQVG